MIRAPLLVLLAAVLVMAVPVSGAVILTVNTSTSVANIGDTITLHGTVNGTPTIAVFLFVTGPDLDPRGVALDNLNIPAGRGMFTTAPVKLSDGTWTYVWDTSIILGPMKPGKYTVYVLDDPVDRQRFIKADYATADIEFLPSDKPVAETPFDPLLPVLALGVTGCMLGVVGWKKE
ncbi:MAG: hypothetical protein M0R30_02840 [Methanoregula sp.]|uniref:hypothetical protein n=1 Tax=Methanoregula sp. TaxID=2052170 RepID=UPI0025F82433|nr:hypothetical protein [Methanoregula sp.]MCK9630556.1 hypothetical protein [Methanoregula sp.]